MDTITELMEKVCLNDFMINSSYWVDVTHINNPHNFYVRPVSYRDYLPMLETGGQQIESSALQPKTMVVFESVTANKFVRGEIINIETGEDIKCYIYATDYGFLEKGVPFLKIRKLQSNFNVPPLAILCRLAECKPLASTWDQQAIEAMKFYVGSEKAQIIVKERAPDALVVALVNSCPDDIAMLMALTGYTTLGYNHNMITKLTNPKSKKHYFTFKKLNIDDVLHVRALRATAEVSLKHFFVAQVNDYKCYLDEMSNFTYFSKTSKSLNADDLKVDKQVAVCVDSTTYERGVVTEITEPRNKARVQLIDLGRNKEVHIMKLREMSEKFFAYPATAIYCSAVESQIWDTGLLKYLYPGHEFIITVKEVGDKFDKPNIVSISPVNKAQLGRYSSSSDNL